MSQQYPDQPQRSADALREEGQQMVGETQHDAEAVVRHAGEEAGAVIDTARREVRDVVDEAVDTMGREADERTRQLGRALHDLSGDLHHMARSDGAGSSTAAEYVDAIATTIDRVAERMEDGGSTGLIDSLRSTANRRPGAFISGSMIAGFVVGRMVRNGDRSAIMSTDGASARHDQQGQDHEPIDEIDLRDPARAEEEYGQPDSRLATAGAVRHHSGPLPPPPSEPPSAGTERF